MEINLRLREMFALSRIVNCSNVLGYRAALKKISYKMLDNDKFSEATSLFEESIIKNKKIRDDHSKEAIKIQKEIQEFKDKKNDEKIPQKLINKVDKFNEKLISCINQENEERNIKFVKLMEEDIEYPFDFNNLLIKAIKNICESEEEMKKDFDISESFIPFILDVYVKLD